MKYSKPGGASVLLTAFITCTFALCGYSQNALNIKLPPLQLNNQRLDNALEIISNKGNFYFSYNSNIIKKDSIVSISTNNASTVKQVLDLLFNGSLEYKESGNYIILRRAPVTLTIVTSQTATEDKNYIVSGYVIDEKTGEKISYASIYEKNRLVSTLTNTKGFFNLRLKSRVGKAVLTVSKEFYQDTTVSIQPKLNQQLTITLLPVEFTGKMITVSPGDYLLPDSIAIDVQIDSTTTRYIYLKADSFKVEKTGIGSFLLSSKLKAQTDNLKKFFTNRPFQVSFTPGLSTHGKLSAQVVNNISFNILGGYSGGVNGIELGGLFNIDKKDVRYLQLAGLFNIVGGSMKGLQIAGLNNTVLSDVEGLQVAGINNMAKKGLKGLQLAGLYNHTSNKVTGLQLGGISNFAKDDVIGSQIGGIANVSARKMNGIQIAGLFNYAKEVRGAQIGGVINYTRRLHGTQIGLINISDSSDGVSFGLINIVLKGYHKLTLSTDEVVNANLAFKTGTKKLYSILQAGYNLDTSKKVFTYGYGIGKELSFGKRFAVNPEISSQYLYLGSWEHLNLLNKFKLNLTVRFGKLFSIFGGPTFSVYYSNQSAAVNGYKFQIPSPGYHTYNFGKYVNGWIGWNAGINLF